MAYVTVFQCITLEGWIVIQYLMEDSFNAIVSCIYFWLLLLLGHFFLLNVTLIIVFNAFMEAGGGKDKEDEEDSGIPENEVQAAHKKQLKKVGNVLDSVKNGKEWLKYHDAEKPESEYQPPGYNLTQQSSPNTGSPGSGGGSPGTPGASGVGIFKDFDFSSF